MELLYLSTTADIPRWPACCTPAAVVALISGDQSFTAGYKAGAENI